MATVRVVHKFEVEFGPDATIEINKDARYVHVGVHAGSVWVWALVDPLEPMKTRHLGYFNTGDDIPSGWQHVGTFLSGDNDELPKECQVPEESRSIYVGHVFGT